MKAISISIPKPCHEDWKKMTPNEQGAHCAVCAKTVVDFSNKTDKEIIAVFAKKGKEKVCGRFAPSQLSRPVVSFGNETRSGRLVKFICALLLVFGAQLFSGVGVFGQTSKGNIDCYKPKTMGKVAVTNCGSAKQTDKEKEADEAKQSEEKAFLRGEVAIYNLGQAEVKEKPLLGDTIIVESIIETEPDKIVQLPEIKTEEPKPMMLGFIMIDPVVQTPEEKLIEEKVIETTYEEELVSILSTTVTGGVNYEIIENEEVEKEETLPQEEITKTTLPIPATKEELFFSVSPNPSVGNVVLSYSLKTRNNVIIELYDITGKHVKTLENTSQQYPGNYNIKYDLSALHDGIYIATIISGAERSSTKIILSR